MVNDDCTPRKKTNPFNRPWINNKPKTVSDEKNNIENVTLFKGVIAGGLTGAIEVLISYPTEFVKTQLQLDEKSSKHRQYNGIVDVIKKTVRRNGFFGLYRGITVLLVFSIPKTAIRFGTFESLKIHAMQENGYLTPTMRLLCGLGAGVNEAIFAVTPMETIKVKFIHDQRSKVPRYNKGLIRGIVAITKDEGFKGVYRGLTPTIIKQGSNQGIRFFIVESLRQWYTGGDSNIRIPSLVVGAFGMCAATVSVLSNTPIDVIKTRMQGLGAKRYKNTFDCAKQIWVHEGPLAFYKGLKARLIKVIGFTYVIYDRVLEAIQNIIP